MYDNLPFFTSNKQQIENFLNSGLLKPVNEYVGYCKDSGEQYTTKRTYKYYNLFFTLTYTSKDEYDELKCKGSFHYLMNQGKHNADKVNFTKAKHFLLEFASLFNVDLFKLELNPPEFGLNLSIPFDITEVVQYTFCEQRKEFSFNPPHIKTSKISGSPANDNRLKFYSKSHDCPKYSEDNILRTEWQIKKTRVLKRIGIKTVGDLLNIDNWKKISEKHIEKFKHLIIYDYTIIAPPSKRIQEKLNNYKSDKYWRALIEDCKLENCSYDKYNDKKEDLNKLSKKYGSNLIGKILEIMRKQWDWFLIEEKHPNYAPLLNPNYAPFIECIACTNKDSPRTCLVTGLDISMQKKSDKLSHTGLRFYHKYDKEIFEMIKSKFLSKNWINSDYETQIKEIAHNIRNAHSNQNRRQKGLYSENQMRLFNIT
ncbi:hypothetical protein [Formosa sp. A9]|uniref:hypothetical protein n=1 Tax=Formosa sp. A9 TaxID=3442641 RepID=UPI003EB8956D